jgi:hypothetical protein
VINTEKRMTIGLDGGRCVRVRLVQGAELPAALREGIAHAEDVDGGRTPGNDWPYWISNDFEVGNTSNPERVRP